MAPSNATEDSDDELCLEDNAENDELRLEDNDDGDSDELQLEDNAEFEDDDDELQLEDNDVQLEDDDDELQLEINDAPHAPPAATAAADETGAAGAGHPARQLEHAVRTQSINSWHDVQLALCASPDASSLDLWRSERCLAATIAYALQRLPKPHTLARGGRGSSGRLLLWLVGAREPLEGELARQGLLVEILHRLCPHEAGWEVVLIGPEMHTWALPAARGGAGLVRAYTGTLHSLMASDALESEKPDAAVLFNSGIGTLLWPLVEGWLPTMVRRVPRTARCAALCAHCAHCAHCAYATPSPSARHATRSPRTVCGSLSACARRACACTHHAAC
eukprot:5346548-Prymnesium_polylepis.1